MVGELEDGDVEFAPVLVDGRQPQAVVLVGPDRGTEVDLQA
ncbi:hypothetical protein ACFV23_07520 [Streptomyces sp. NPDC059627]